MTYTDAAGNRYREVGAAPYSELVEGTPFLFNGKVCLRSKSAPPQSRPGLDALGYRLCEGIYNARVTLLERVEGE